MIIRTSDISERLNGMITFFRLIPGKTMQLLKVPYRPCTCCYQ